MVFFDICKTEYERQRWAMDRKDLFLYCQEKENVFNIKEMSPNGLQTNNKAL